MQIPGHPRVEIVVPVKNEEHDLGPNIRRLRAFLDTAFPFPAEVCIAVPRGTRVPRVSAPPIRVFNVSTAVFDLGIEEHRIEGQAVRIYSLARTVADCFRFRNKVGLDVALEALTEAWRSKRLKLDELNRIAKKLRVQRVMQPYLETVVM